MKSNPEKEALELKQQQLLQLYINRDSFLSDQTLDGKWLCPSCFPAAEWDVASKTTEVWLVFNQPFMDDYKCKRLNPTKCELKANKYTKSDKLQAQIATEKEAGEYAKPYWRNLYRLLHKHGLHRRAYTTFAYRQSTFGKRLLKKESEVYRPAFDLEFNLCAPKIVIAFGSEAYKWVMQTNAKLTTYLGEPVPSPYGICIPVYGLDYVYDMSPNDELLYDHAFDKARQIIDNSYTRKMISAENMEIVFDPVAADKVVDYYLQWLDKPESKPMPLAYDCEWTTDGRLYEGGEELVTFQFCCESGKAYVFVIRTHDKKENRMMLTVIQKLLIHSKIRRMGWNIRADDKRLRYRGLIIPEETLFFDGMKAMAFIDSRYRKGLEYGIRYFTNWENYSVPFYQAMDKHGVKYKDMCKMFDLEPGLFFMYCAGDALTHYDACINMNRILKNMMKAGTDSGPGRAAKYYYDTYLPLTNYFIELEEHGLPINKDKLQELTDMYMGKYQTLRAKLDAFVIPKYMPVFNPNSSNDKVELLFKILKIDAPFFNVDKKARSKQWVEEKLEKYNNKVPWKTKTERADRKSLSTILYTLQARLKQYETEIEDAEMLADIQQYGLATENWTAAERPMVVELLKSAIATRIEAVRLLLDVASISVFANRFLSRKGLTLDMADDEEERDEEDPLKQSYWAAMHTDGRAHADFYECLDNFRASSTPNVQNPASKVLAHIPEIFVPGYGKMTKDEQKLHEHEIPANIRHIFWTGDPDYVFLEADIASAEILLSATLSGDDDYLKDVLSGSFHLIKAREYFKDPNLTKNDIGKYTVTKALNFRLIYCADYESSIEPIKADIYAESGYDISETDLQYAMRTWDRYKRYTEWREELKHSASEYGYVDNARGMRFYFHSRNMQDQKYLATCKNQALNWPVSGELALLAWDITMRTRAHFKKQGEWLKYVYPLNTVHDALYFKVHKDLMKDNYAPNVVKEIFTTTQCATGQTLGVEVVVTDIWKGKQKHFSNETKWIPDRKVWEWKD